MNSMNTIAVEPRVVSRDEWVAARQALLVREKALTRARDEVSALRRQLPWVRVDKPYVFDTLEGPKTLGDLFAGRSQLIVYHFMFGPGWREGCVGCSLLSDHLDGPLRHLQHRDVAFTAISRAPLAEIEPFRLRMGWKFRWVSSNGSDFNYDFHVSFTPEQLASGRVYYNFQDAPTNGTSEEASGTSVFYRDESGEVFHTYSSYGRGGEGHLGVYHLLDLTPHGRDEHVRGNLTDWVRHHDRYGAGGTVETTGRYVADAQPAAESPCCKQHRQS
jgi:predicted dithiol-disulfide oxidoreductase (DUF899 family)